MMNTRKLLSLALALALLLTAIPCAFAEDAEEWDGGLRRLRLGSSFYTVMIDDDFFLGDMTEEDIAEGQVAYYQRGDEGMDFDVYQFPKDDPADRPYRYVLEEAMEQDHVVEVRPNEQVDGIDIAWYRAIEGFDGAEYETLNVIADDGVYFVEMVFWMADEADAAEAQAIVDSLQLVDLQQVRLGDSPFILYVPGDFEAGGLTLEDEEDDQMAYYTSEATALDFDVYQFGKDGLPESLSEHVAQEAAEYPVITELVTDGEINDVPVGWYRTVEECEEGEYDTITYIMDASDSFVEIVFWLDGFTAEAEADYIIHNLLDTRRIAEDDGEGLSDETLAYLEQGVVPVTWEVTPEHPMIDTDEARALYQQILAGDYPTMEELRANPVVQQLDALSNYYYSIYGNTAEIDTPEREALREELKDWFLTLGSARTESVDENGKHHYVYDGPLNRDYQMILALGLPASGKSTFIADPDSEAMGAFILDVDVIKAQIPEYIESHGAASGSIHFEGIGIFDRAISEFLTGDMQGVNIVLPIVGGDFDEMMQQYVLPFEAAGYNVKVKFREAKENEAAARVVMRELGGGQLINSAVAFNFGDGPENVYNQIKDMINAKGEPYGFEEDEALEPAA